MMRDITERIDDMCMDMHGHTNWVCLDTLSDQEKVGLDQVADIVNIEGQHVAFYHQDITERTYLVLNLNPDTGEVEGTAQWTVAEIIAEINRDRGVNWQDYDESDWQEGWREFVEGKPCYGIRGDKWGYHSIPELWKSVHPSKSPSLVELGKISVDSGMVMISDPCYLSSLKPDYMDNLIIEAVSPRHEKPSPDGGNVDVFTHGGMAVASGTAYGDGVFPVMAEVVEDTNPMRIERIVIDFT
jgi:hypothetical protein